MPYKNPFMRLNVSGTLFDFETFSFGFTFVHTGTGTIDAPQEVPAGMVSALSTYFAGELINNKAKMKLVKFNLIGVDGHYANQGTTVLHEYTTPIAGASPSPIPPAQNALAVSLRTPIGRGRAHAGRFYLPLCSATIDADGHINAGQRDAELVRVTTLLNALNAASGNWKLGVVSNLGIGEENLVTHARIGRTMDTIRSRRTKIPEAYVDGEQLASI
jgi:hypothetical protein